MHLKRILCKLSQLKPTFCGFHRRYGVWSLVSQKQAFNKHRLVLHKRFCSSTEQQLTLDDVKKVLLKEKAQVVVMAGAGISTPSGLPDFRTPGTGLYDTLDKYNLPYPEAVFDIEYFHYNPEPFFKLAQELYPSGKLKPNLVHYFVKLLNNKGILLKMYTQNIDGLERLAGIPVEKLVEAHGTFSTARCRKCGGLYLGAEIEEYILAGKVAKCTEIACDGVVKPNIVFFGEQLSEEFYEFYTVMQQADLLIVMGTSLEVYPFASVADAVRPGTPRVLFNMTMAESFNTSSKYDVVVLGDLIENLTKLCNDLGWYDKLKGVIDHSEERLAAHKTQHLRK